MKYSNQAQELHLDPDHYATVVSRLERLRRHLNPDVRFMVVGSLALRFQFPDYYLDFKPHRVNDIDVIAQVSIYGQPMVLPALLDDFYLMSSYQQFEAYSLFIRRKEELDNNGKIINSDAFEKIDVFTGARAEATNKVIIGNDEWLIPSKAEIFLKVCRDIFFFAAKHVPGQPKWRLSEKHRKFYRFMVDPQRANIFGDIMKDLEAIWPTEAHIIQTNIESERAAANENQDGYFNPRVSEFAGIKEYIDLISELVEVDDNFVSQEEIKKEKNSVLEDNRPPQALQEPYGLKPVSGEEYIRILAQSKQRSSKLL